MRRSSRTAFALVLVALAGQSCVLEPLDANRIAEGGTGGDGAGNGVVAGRGGAANGVAGTVSAAGTKTGGAAGASTGGGMAGAAGTGGGKAGAAGSESDAGAAGQSTEPPVDWIRCDPTFAYGVYVECPSLQPAVGDACDSDIFFPEDFCAYCENPEQCPVQTDYVALQCQNRLWRLNTVFGIGCCPDQRPIHGSACDSNAFCEYGGFSDVCECIDSTWQCCSDAFDGAACNNPGDECIFSLSAIDADKCTCTGPASTAVWSCCPYFAPVEGDVCYYDAVTCVYPERTCNCASTSSLWSCN